MSFVAKMVFRFSFLLFLVSVAGCNAMTIDTIDIILMIAKIALVFFVILTLAAYLSLIHI